MALWPNSSHAALARAFYHEAASSSCAEEPLSWLPTAAEPCLHSAFLAVCMKRAAARELDQCRLAKDTVRSYDSLPLEHASILETRIKHSLADVPLSLHARSGTGWIGVVGPGSALAAAAPRVRARLDATACTALSRLARYHALLSSRQWCVA